MVVESLACGQFRINLYHVCRVEVASIINNFRMMLDITTFIFKKKRLFSPSPLSLSLSLFDGAEDQTQGFAQAGQVLYD
jgi:hypothetical protein